MSNEEKKQLEKQLWAVANVLRGKMNADEYKNYILVLMVRLSLYCIKK